MKFITTQVVLILLLHWNVNAQTIDSVYEVMNPRTNNFWNHIVRILPVDDTSFIAVTLHGQFYKLNAKGQILWSSSIPYSNSYPVLILDAYIPYESLPGNLFIVTQEDYCDAIGQNEWYKFDLNGNFIDQFDLYPFTTGLTVIPNSFYLFPAANDLPKYLLTTEESLIFWYSRDSMIFRPNVLHLENGDINSKGDILLASSDSLYIYYNVNGQFNLSFKLKYTSDGTYKDWISWISDTTFILREDEHFSLFDNTLKLLEDYTVPPEEIIESFNWYKPYIEMLIRKDSGKEILILDQGLHEIFRAEYELTNSYYDKLFWSPDSILTKASLQYYEGGEGFNYIKTFDYSADGMNHNYDVSISNAKYYDSELIGDTTCMGFPIYDSYLVRNVQFTITNNSEFLIHNVIITSTEPYCHFYCYPTPFFHRALTEINLMPGMTKSISLGDIKLEQERQDIPKDLCLMVMLPDYHFDGNLANNKSCLQETVSTNSIEDENKLELFPNPTSDRLYFSGQTEILEVSIYSLEGKRVSNFARSEIEHKSFDISHLTPGMYFVRYLTTDGIVFTNKIIKV